MRSRGPSTGSSERSTTRSASTASSASDERHAVVVVPSQLLRPADEQSADDVVRQRLERIAHDRRIVLTVDQDERPFAHVERTSSSIRVVYFSYVFVSVENWMIRSCSWNG